MTTIRATLLVGLALQLSGCGDATAKHAKDQDRQGRVTAVGDELGLSVSVLRGDGSEVVTNAALRLVARGTGTWAGAGMVTDATAALVSGEAFRVRITGAEGNAMLAAATHYGVGYGCRLPTGTVDSKTAKNGAPTMTAVNGQTAITTGDAVLTAELVSQCGDSGRGLKLAAVFWDKDRKGLLDVELPLTIGAAAAK